MTRIYPLKEEEQTVHDKALEEISVQLRLANRELKIFTNPDNMHNSKVDGYFPDIVGWKGGAVQLIGEVEVENSVNEKESEQWRLYALLRKTFFLYVPKTKGAEARELLSSRKIQTTELWAYTLGSTGVSLEKVPLEIDT